MKLYTSPGACSLSDHIVLCWIGKPFDLKIVKGAEKKTPEFLQLNPAGAVPVLDDNGWILTQNLAILNYLCDLHPDAKLAGDGSAKDRAEVNRWLSFLNADVHPTFHPFFGSTKALGKEADDKSQELAKIKLRSYFERLNAQLTSKTYLTGERSIADPYLFVLLRWAHATKIDLSGLDNLAVFEQHMRADSGVQAALQAEGLS